MSWFKKAAKMRLDEALDVFGLKSVPPIGELKSTYRRLMMLYHPDRNPGKDVFQESTKVNNAYEVLSNAAPGSDVGNSHAPFGRPAPRQQRPEWQTDDRSSYNGVNETLGRTGLNYCLKEIYEHSMQNGPVENWWFQTFDGNFFRSSFTAKSNPQSFDFAAEVITEWTTKGANPYDVRAVFVSKDKRLQMITLNGQNVLSQNIVFDVGGINDNPGNDQQLVKRIQKMVQENKVDIYA